jgi:transposase
MAMGRRRPAQQGLWIDAGEIAKGPGHVFYRALNEVLQRHGFDRFVEELIEKKRLFADGVGRPSVPPGVYFRMSLVGYFEGLGSERGVAWRCADSLGLREFLGYDVTQAPPDHSTVSRWRRKLPLSVHRKVFAWVVRVAREEGVLKGRQVAVDSTTLEANAAMKSIVRKADGATYQQYLRKLAEAEGREQATAAELQQMDRKRKKKVSNRQWKSGTDPDARIARMKDGRTRMAYKVETAVDLGSGVTLAAETHTADRDDRKTVEATLLAADETVMNAGVAGGIEDAVMDKGYHSDAVVTGLEARGYRGFVSEPKVRGRRNWKRCQRRFGAEEADRRRRAIHANRRRTRSARGRALQRKRAEYPERAFALMKRSGGLGRVHVRGRREVSKKVQLHVAAANLGVVLRKLTGIGTPRSLQGRLAAALSALLVTFWSLLHRIFRPHRDHGVSASVSPSPATLSAVPNEALAAST